MPRTVNPKWVRDELILALDLYLRHGAVGKQHPAALELTELLQRVGPKSSAADAERFRNINGVAMKLANFMAIDPAAPAKGLQAGGRLEGVIWDEFAHDRTALAAEVSRIKKAAGVNGAMAPAEERVVEGAVRPRAKGQGFMRDVQRKLAVEKHAVAVATLHYRAAGWAVDDVGSTECFDLRCTRAGVELHVEVKGTTGMGAAVLLTANEVEHAETYPHVALFILSGIAISGDTEPVASGGTPQVLDPWTLDRAGLRPTAYEYRVA